ncbi:MAG: BLUF domain-containing protein [Cyclobacteriaceae bacterium]
MNNLSQSSQSKIVNKNQLTRLVYSSVRMKSCTDESIQEILDTSRKNNPKSDITGLLVHTDRRFLQILEGPYQKVMETYQRIEQDTRHGGSNIRYCEPTSERYFKQWHMASKNISKDVEFGTDLLAEEKGIYEKLMDGDLQSYKDEGMRILKTFLMVS